MPGTITLIGSGEFSDSMSRVHRKALARIEGPVDAVFLDTPAGFELNADEISAKAAEYFSQHFDVTLRVASFKNRERATASSVAQALGTLVHANFIFAGPGSPSYAIRNWRGTPLWASVIDRWQNGAQLGFASAAALTTGAYTIPVYEIYKAGQDPHWIEGLNLLAAIGLDVAVVPHWNNAEGGTFDTRFCYMGAPRLELLESQLPPSTVILGIDEYTACIIDADAGRCEVLGAGEVTVRHGGKQWSYPSGETFGLDRLRAKALAAAGQQGGSPGAGEQLPRGEPSAAAAAATGYLHQLAHALRESNEAEQQRDLIERAHDAVHELSAEWLAADEHSGEDIGPFLQLLVDLRAQLRSAKQYALADEIRVRLADLGVIIQDTPNGTVWQRKEP